MHPAPSSPEARIPALALSIVTALQDVGRAVPEPDLVAQAAGFLAISPDLERTIQSLGWGIKQNAHPAQAVLIAYQRALAEKADPLLWIARLRWEEAELRRAADYHLRTAADYWGKCGGKWVADSQKAHWTSCAQASEELSAENLDAAAAKSSEADDLQRRIDRTGALMAAVVDDRRSAA
jgi:hypothetical protein